MKKILLSLIILFTTVVSAQENAVEIKPKKDRFQIGAQFNPPLEGGVGSPGGTIRINVITVGRVNFTAGLNGVLLQTNHPFYSDSFVWNPNMTTEFALFKFNLRPYIGIGYAFFTEKYKPNSYVGLENDPLSDYEETNKFKGYSANIGVRYYFKKLVFIDLGYGRRTVKAPREFERSTNFVNIGAGVHF